MEFKKVYSEDLKRGIVREIEEGLLSIKDASLRIGISKKCLRAWLSDYGKYQPEKSILEITMKSEEDKIRQLEKALANSQVELMVYKELLKVASDHFNCDIKKNFGSQPLESSIKEEKKE